MSFLGCSVLSKIGQLTFGQFNKVSEINGSQNGSEWSCSSLTMVKDSSSRRCNHHGVTNLKRHFFRDTYFRQKLKEHQQNIDSQSIKDLADEIIKISQKESDLQK